MVTSALEAAMRAPPKAKARLELFGAAFFFGLMAVAARFAAQGGFGFGPLATIRFGVGMAGCVALFRMRPGLYHPVNKRMLIWRGLLGGLAVLLYFFSLSRIPAGEATLLNNTFPIFATIFGVVVMKERATVHLWLGLLLASLGVLIILGIGGLDFSLGLGEIAGILSAVVAACSTASIRSLRPTDNAPTIFFAFCAGGLVTSLPLSFTAWPSDPFVWAIAIAMGLCSMIAQLLMTDSYGPLTVPEAAIWQQLTPVASYLWAIALLGEAMRPLDLIGILFVLGGVLWGGLFGGEAKRGRWRLPS